MLVDIDAAAVNLLDAKVQAGEFKAILPYKAPFVLGHDLLRSGTGSPLRAGWDGGEGRRGRLAKPCRPFSGSAGYGPRLDGLPDPEAILEWAVLGSSQ